MQTDHDIYPMPLFVRLAVSDVEESATWYRSLGFDVVYSTPVMAHVRYRKYADVMLAAAPDASGDEPPSEDAAPGRGVAIYVTVTGESVDDVAERADELGAKPPEGPHETPWNTRETTVLDPDGYELVFSEPVDTDRTFEEVMDGADGERDPD